MSEYQYYEFVTVDRPLGKSQIAELRELSTRATITPTRFQNTYNFGDFRGNPDRLIERYFDAFVYVANWGTHWLMFRLPSRLLDPAVASRYEVEDCLETRTVGEHVILSFRSESEDVEWVEGGEEWLPSLTTLRSDLAAGDLRCLYLGWLAGAAIDESMADEVEPPVPAGLASLTAPLTSLVDFLRLDPDLVATAAERSAPLPPEPPRDELERWLRALPDSEKDDILIRLVDDASGLGMELRQRFRRARSPRVAESSEAAESPRTVAALLAAAEVRAERRRREEAAREAKERARREREQALARAKYLDGLAGRESELWQRVDLLAGTKTASGYDEALQRVLDLRDLAARASALAEFRARLGDLRRRYPRSWAFLRRLDDAGLG
jgi:hypothetical protein